MRTVLIRRTASGDFDRSELNAPRAVARIAEGSPFQGLLVVPIREVDEAMVVLLVPDEVRGTAIRNGMPLDGGVHVLQHGDQVEFGEDVFWIARESRVVQASYDPDQHGPDVACFLTKTQIRPGEIVAICPGLPGRPCGVIYSAAAWELAMQSAEPIRCRNCGFHPADAAWAPPEPKERADLDELLQLVTHSGG